MLVENLVVLDFETTGLSPDSGDRITEVAAVRIRKGRIVDRFESLVNCGRRLPAFIIHLTGITQRMVDNAPPVNTVIRELIRFLDGDPVIAHNARFDERFFRSECEHVRARTSIEPFICSMLMAQRVYPSLSSYKLSALATSLGLAFQGRGHRAPADAQLTAELVLMMVESMHCYGSQVQINSALLRKFVDLPVSMAMSSLLSASGRSNFN